MLTRTRPAATRLASVAKGRAAAHHDVRRLERIVVRPRAPRPQLQGRGAVAATRRPGGLRLSRRAGSQKQRAYDACEDGTREAGVSRESHPAAGGDSLPMAPASPGRQERVSGSSASCDRFWLRPPTCGGALGDPALLIQTAQCAICFRRARCYASPRGGDFGRSQIRTPRDSFAGEKCEIKWNRAFK